MLSNCFLQSISVSKRAPRRPKGPFFSPVPRRSVVPFCDLNVRPWPYTPPFPRPPRCGPPDQGTQRHACHAPQAAHVRGRIVTTSRRAASTIRQRKPGPHVWTGNLHHRNSDNRPFLGGGGGGTSMPHAPLLAPAGSATLIWAKPLTFARGLDLCQGPLSWRGALIRAAVTRPHREGGHWCKPPNQNTVAAAESATGGGAGNIYDSPHAHDGLHYCPLCRLM